MHAKNVNRKFKVYFRYSHESLAVLAIESY